MVFDKMLRLTEKLDLPAIRLDFNPVKQFWEKQVKHH
jgi:hypothetical protein